MNDQASTLALLRILIGLGAWLAPGISGRLFGLDPKGNPQAPFLARLFGIRDLALGVGTLTTSGGARRTWLKLGVLCDSADAAAAWIGGRDGSLPRYAALMSGTVAVGAAGLGAATLAAAEPAGGE